MIILITGATHTGKTLLAQKLLEQYRYPYLSMDHVKMGLIRSGVLAVKPTDSDERLTAVLWPVFREIIKTAVENGQHLIVEGCYVPADWEGDFDESYRSQIQLICLLLTEDYITEHGNEIVRFASVIEDRGGDEGFDLSMLREENLRYQKMFGDAPGAIILQNHNWQ